MSFAATAFILTLAFVALLVVLWLIMASSKSTLPAERKGHENPASEIVPVDTQATQKAAAEQQGKTTTAVAAWWWLNHRSDSRNNDTKEDK